MAQLAATDPSVKRKHGKALENALRADPAYVTTKAQLEDERTARIEKRRRDLRDAADGPKAAGAANAVAERFVGSVRRELLDQVLLVDDLHFASLVRRYQRYFNESRPHQGIRQRVPTKPVLGIDASKPIEVTSVLRGLHVDDRRAA